MQEELKRYVVARVKPINGVQLTRVVMPNLQRSILEVVAAVDLENFRYFYFETIDMETRRGEGMLTCKTNVWQRSENFFINAYIETYEDVCVNNQHLASQMNNLGWTHIVRNLGCENYWVEKFDPDCDKIIDLQGNLIGV